MYPVKGPVQGRKDYITLAYQSKLRKKLSLPLVNQLLLFLDSINSSRGQ